jgi:hypothetical protein
VATLHRVFKALDVAAFEQAVGNWLAATGVQPAEPIALDGKTLRGVHGAGLPGVHLISAHAHGAGAILAQVRSAGKGQELAAVRSLLAAEARARDLVAGRFVTGDALLTQRTISAQIVAGGGAYVWPVDANHPARREGIAEAFSPLVRRES